MNNFKILLEKLTIDELHNYDYIFSEWDRGIGHGAIAKSFSKGEVATRKAILKYLDGAVRCQVCDIFLDPTGSVQKATGQFCLCCGNRVRTKPRSNKCKMAYANVPTIKA